MEDKIKALIEKMEKDSEPLNVALENVLDAIEVFGTQDKEELEQLGLAEVRELSVKMMESEKLQKTEDLCKKLYDILNK